MRIFIACIGLLALTGCYYDSKPRKRCTGGYDVSYYPRPSMGIPDGSIGIGGGIELTPVYTCRKWEIK